MPDSSPPAFEFAARHRLHTCDDFIFEVDQFTRGIDQFLIAHLRAFRWSASVFKQMLSLWPAHRIMLRGPVFALGEHDDHKWRRFVSHFGFTPHLPVVCENGQPRLLYINR